MTEEETLAYDFLQIQPIKLTDVYCIIKIPKVAKEKWRKLHLHFGECCSLSKTDLYNPL